MMNGRINGQRVVAPAKPEGFMKYGGDQEDKIVRAVEILRERSDHYRSMDEEEATMEVEGVASASNIDVDHPDTTAYDIVHACLNKSGSLHGYDEEE